MFAGCPVSPPLGLVDLIEFHFKLHNQLLAIPPWCYYYYLLAPMLLKYTLLAFHKELTMCQFT